MLSKRETTNCDYEHYHSNTSAQAYTTLQQCHLHNLLFSSYHKCLQNETDTFKSQTSVNGMFSQVIISFIFKQSSI